MATHCSPTPRDTPSDVAVPLSHGDEHLLHKLGACHANAGQPCVLQLWDDAGGGSATQLLASTNSPALDMHCTLRAEVPPPHAAEHADHVPVHHEYGDVPGTPDADRLATAVCVALRLCDGDADVDVVPDGELDTDTVSEDESDGLGDGEVLIVVDRESLADTLSVDVADSDADGESVAVVLSESVTVTDVDVDCVAARVAVDDRVAVTLTVTLRDFDRDSVTVGDDDAVEDVDPLVDTLVDTLVDKELESVTVGDGVSVGVTDTVSVGEPDGSVDGDSGTLPEYDALAVAEPWPTTFFVDVGVVEMDRENDGVSDGVSDGVGAGVAVPVGVTDSVTVHEIDCVTLPVHDRDLVTVGVREMVGVMDATAVRLADSDSDSESEGEYEIDSVAVEVRDVDLVVDRVGRAELERLMESEMEGVTDGDSVLVGLLLGDGVLVDVHEMLSVTVSDSVLDGVRDDESEMLALKEMDSVRDGVTDGVSVRVGVTELVGDTESDTVTVPERVDVREMVGETDSVRDGVGVADDVHDRDWVAVDVNDRLDDIDLLCVAVDVSDADDVNDAEYDVDFVLVVDAKSFTVPDSFVITVS